jgi:hypothetical protein
MGSGFTRALDAKGLRHFETEGVIREIAKELSAKFASA